jgi:predicted proteasome-type protease
MKVIAKIDRERVLVEANIEELALLNGFRSRYDQGFDSHKMTEVNSELNIQKMVTTSQYVRGMRKEVLEKARKELEMAIERIDGSMDEISKLTIFETLKESNECILDQ